jgi:hypothetical protein
MPKASWGIDSSDVDEFDRDSQFVPYDGPTPPNGMYWWNINVLKYAARTKDKLPQLRVGLELVGRDNRPDDEPYIGYFITAFLPVSDKTAFRYVPLLDALGVSGREFKERTIVDDNSNITRIGNWRNSGEQLIAAQLKDGQDANGNSRKEIGVFAAIKEDEDSEDYADDDFEDLDD